MNQVLDIISITVDVVLIATLWSYIGMNKKKSISFVSNKDAYNDLEDILAMQKKHKEQELVFESNLAIKEFEAIKKAELEFLAQKKINNL